MLHPKLFHWLVASRPARPLLPNITRLVWRDGIPDAYYHCAPVLFGRRLTDIRICCQGPHREHAEAIASMLQSMPESSPKLQHLDVITRQRVKQGSSEAAVNAFQTALGHVFTALTGLESVLLNIDHSIPLENVVKLSSLLCLKSLMVHITSDDPFSTAALIDTAKPSNDQERTFHALRSICIMSRPLDKSALVLSTFRFPSLRSITLECYQCSESAVFERALEYLGGIRSTQQLENLRLTTGDGEVGCAQASGGCVTMAALRHICVFHNLRSVDIVTEMSIVLGDDELKDMVTSWPLLKFLKLVTDTDFSENEYLWRQQTKVTLRGLVHIVQHCPSLRKLAIDVDTRDCNIPTDAKVAGQCCNTRIRRLALGQSYLLGDPVKIGAFLLATFPNLTHIARGWSEYDDEIDETDEWKPVCDAMQAIRVASSQEDELLVLATTVRYSNNVPVSSSLTDIDVIRRKSA